MIAQLPAGRPTTRWLWPIASATYFVAASGAPDQAARRRLFISEVWFGWATQEELQPNIDGLSFDEVLLIGLLPGIAAVLISWYVTRRRRRGLTNASSRSDAKKGQPG